MTSFTVLRSLFNFCRIPLIRDGLINTGHVNKKAMDTPQPLRGLKILDVGCGGGILTEPMARIGANVTGVDVSNELIEVAQIHASQDPCLSDQVQYICDTIENHAETYKEYYDAVVASEVLEHITQKDLFISACTATLKPGGAFFITTMSQTFLGWAGGIIAAEYIVKLVPQGTHEWDKFITPKEMQIILEKYHCSTMLVHGMLYNFVADSWHWSGNTSISYALHAVKRKDP